MYDNYNEDTLGANSLNNVRIKAKNISVTTKSAVNATKDINRIIKKPNTKDVTKIVGKNIVKGNIRINGRVVQSLYNKNEDSNIGLNSMMGAANKTNQGIITARNTVDDVKNISKASKKVFQISEKAIKGIASFIAKLAIANPFMLAFILIILLIVILSSYVNNDDEIILLMSGIAGTQKVIITDDDAIAKYKELLYKLDDQINSISEDYTSYEYIEVNGFAETPIKEILSVFAVIKEQEIEFNNDNINKFSDLHSLFYTIDIKEAIEYCGGCYCNHSPEADCAGNCKCNGHSKIIINITKLTFEEILEKLEFNDEQKQWAKNLLETDYKDLYSNLE